MDLLYISLAALYLANQLTWKHALYVVLTYPLYWLLKKLWKFFAGMFWLGFRESWKEQMRLGRPMTQEEHEALKKKLQEKIEKKVAKILNPADEE